MCSIEEALEEGHMEEGENRLCEEKEVRI